MGLIHAEVLPGTVFAVGVELRILDSVNAVPAGVVPQGCTAPMPRASVLSEFGVAWQGQAPGFSATARVRLNGAVIKTVPLAGVSGFALAPASDDPFVPGGQVQLTIDNAGPSGGAVQMTCLIRDAAGVATKGRLLMGFPAAGGGLPAYLSIGTNATRENIDGSWFGDAPDAPLGTGLLIPIAGTLVRQSARVDANLLAGAGLDIGAWDVIGAGYIVAPISYAVLETGFKTAVVATPVAAGTVLDVRGATAAGAGSVSGAVSFVGQIALP